MSPHTRRQFIGGLMTAAALAPVRTLAAAVKPVTIRDVDIFPIEIPVTAAERDASYDHRFSVVKVETSAGTRGYSFAGPPAAVLPEVRKVLLGQDLFAIERHLLQHGLIRWGGVEHALWDAIGRIAGRPVFQLLGGKSDRNWARSRRRRRSRVVMLAPASLESVAAPPDPEPSEDLEALRQAIERLPARRYRSGRCPPRSGTTDSSAANTVSDQCPFLLKSRFSTTSV